MEGNTILELYELESLGDLQEYSYQDDPRKSGAKNTTAKNIVKAKLKPNKSFIV